MARSRDERGVGLAGELYWVVIGGLSGLALATLSVSWQETVGRWAWVGLVVLLAGGALHLMFRGYRQWTRTRPWPGGNPYPGLDAFSDRFSRVFHGRRERVDQIADRIRNHTAIRSRFVAVVGPSGCGKSSLVLAGVVPAVGRNPYRRDAFFRELAVVPEFTPGSNPLAALANALAEMAPAVPAEPFEGELRGEAAQVVAALRSGGAMPAPSRLLQRLRRLRGRHPRIVVVIDQLEEAATAGPDARQEFMALIHAALRAEAKLVVLATLRSDLLGRFQEGLGADLFREPELVGAMSYSELRKVITGPAQDTHTTISDELVDRMVQDHITGADALPLLSLTLHDLYAHALADHQITSAEYSKAFAEDNPVIRLAKDALDELGDLFGGLSKQDLLRQVLDTWLRAVNIDGSEVVRRHFPYDELDERQRTIVDVFARKRLLTHHTESGGRPTVDVTHEVVLRRWSDLEQHIQDNADALRLRTRLESRARTWQEAGRLPGFLLHGEELRQAAQYRLLRGGVLGEFVAQSLASDSVETARRADTAARQSLEALGAVPDPESAVKFALAAVTELAPTQLARFALYRSWASGLRGVLRQHAGWVTALAWAPNAAILASGSHDKTVKICDAETEEITATLEHQAEVTSIAWSPDAQTLAVAGHDGTVCLWSPDGQLRHRLAGHEGPAVSVALSPDGTRLASGSDDHTVRIWSVVDSTLLHTLSGHEGWVSAVAWSPGGEEIASASYDGSVVVWSREGELLRSLSHDDKAVAAVAWSADGEMLATGLNNGSVGIWQSGGTLKRTIDGHSGAVSSLAWSVAGAIATGSDDGTIRVFSHEGQLLRRLVLESAVSSVTWLEGDSVFLCAGLHDGTIRIWVLDDMWHVVKESGPGPISSLCWATDGSGLLAGAFDGRIHLWDTYGTKLLSHELAEPVTAVSWGDPDLFMLFLGNSEGKIAMLNADGFEWLPGHDSSILSIAYSPETRMVATGSSDKTIRLRGLAGEPDLTITGHTKPVRSVAWSPDGAWLASGSDDRTVGVWGADGSLAVLFTGHDGRINAVAWSPDGTLVASASHDRTVRLWTVAGEHRGTLGPHDNAVTCVAWSPDGSRLATGCSDRTLRIWAIDGELMYTLQGHVAGINAIAWSVLGSVASGANDGSVCVWPEPVTIAELVEQATEATSFRALNPDERLRAMLPPVKGG